MKLYYTTTSPFARKVRLFALESGIEKEIELVQTTVRDPLGPLLAISPPGKVPVLETHDGMHLSEAVYICAYLEERFESARRFPRDAKRWQAVEMEGLACGLLDGVVTWVRALRAPSAARNVKAIALEEARVKRCLDAFDALAPQFNPAAERIPLRQITLICALGALCFRLPDVDWRKNHPALEQWWDAISNRHSLIETAPFES